MNSQKFERVMPRKYFRSQEAADFAQENELGESLLTFMRENAITKGTILVNRHTEDRDNAHLTVTLYWEEQ